jgi:hypothetical protein
MFFINSTTTRRLLHQTHSPKAFIKVQRLATDCQTLRDQELSKSIHSTSYPLGHVCERICIYMIANVPQNSFGPKTKQTDFYSRVIFRSSSNIPTKVSTNKQAPPLLRNFPLVALAWPFYPEYSTR